MKQIRMGIIGYGIQGNSYAKSLADNKVTDMVLGGICDADPVKREQAKGQYENTPLFDNYITMIESGTVDAVITTVAHYLHPIIAIEAIRRKMPVISEKPAGVYTKQVRQLNEFSAAHPEVPFAMMFNQRTNPLYQEVRNIVKRGEIGAIRRTNWIMNNWWRIQAYYDQSSWRATWGADGGGVLVNQAPHQLDLLQWICGKPVSVYAKAGFGLHRDIAVENDVTAILDYGNGATGVFVTCTHDAIGTDRFEIDGSKGKIVIEDGKKALVTIQKQDEEAMNREFSLEMVAKLMAGGCPAELLDKRVIEFPSTGSDQYCLVLENFAAHILRGEPLLADGREGIESVRLANAMLLSAWTKTEVPYEFDEELFLDELNKRIAAEGLYPLQS